MRINPATGQVVSTLRAACAADCEGFAALAAAAYAPWAALPPARRAAHLAAIADEIETRRAAFRAVMAEELGAPGVWADHNVTFAADILRSIAAYVPGLESPEPISGEPGVTDWAERVPCGVCLGIAPWNAPLILGVRAMAAPLLCGNTVLLKGSEFAPRTFMLLNEAMQSAGLPKDVARVFVTRAEDSEAIVGALIASPVVRRVNFTGSTRVGRRVAEICASHLKRALLELGGQSTMVVLDDADVDVAADAVLHGAYINQGQVCMSTERLVVADALADKLVARIETARSALVVGDPLDPATRIGPVISEEAAQRLSGLVGDAVARGATLVGGGQADGAFFQPTLLDHLDPTMRLYHEEAFGPVLSVIRVDNDLEAITVANDSEYGLAASVFSRDAGRAEKVARQIHSGICHINRTTVNDNPHAPFGGVKSSGHGRFGGRWGLHEFTELRWLSRRDGDS